MFTPGFKIKAPLAHLFFEDIKVEKSERNCPFSLGKFAGRALFVTASLFYEEWARL
jgi:hypothetical protein